MTCMLPKSRDCRSSNGVGRRVLLFCLTFTALVLLIPGTALAYLDPGTGSYLLQVALATLLGGLVTLRLYWKKLKNRFRGSKLGDEDEQL